MWKFSFVPVLVLLCITAHTQAAVLELNEDTFDTAVRSDGAGASLVAFVAPWCGHCKRLYPVLDSLAEKVEKDGIALRVAKVDATANNVEGVSIRGYPTIKLFTHDGQKIHDYDGDRSIASFLKFFETMTGPAVREVDTIPSDMPEESAAFLLLGGSKSTWAAMERIADNHRMTAFFFGIKNPTEEQLHAANASGTPALLSRNCGVRSELTADDMDEETMTKFVEENADPIFEELNGVSYQRLRNRRRYTVVAVADPADKGTKEFLSTFKSLANGPYKKDFTFCYLNAVVFKSIVPERSNVPGFFVMEGTINRYYHSGQVSVKGGEEGIVAFLSDVLAGTVQPKGKNTGLVNDIRDKMRSLYENKYTIAATKYVNKHPWVAMGAVVCLSILLAVACIGLFGLQMRDEDTEVPAPPAAESGARVRGGGDDERSGDASVRQRKPEGDGAKKADAAQESGAAKKSSGAEGKKSK